MTQFTQFKTFASWRKAAKLAGGTTHQSRWGITLYRNVTGAIVAEWFGSVERIGVVY